MTSNDISLEILQQLNQEFAIKEADFYSTIKNLHQHEDQLNAEIESLKVELIGRNENTQTKIAEITHLQSLIAELEQEKVAFQNTYNEQLNVYRESMNEYKEELEAQINTIGTELKTQTERSTEYLTSLGQREKEFARELAKLRESGDLQRQSIETQYKEVIAELSNEYKTRESNLASQIENIRTELKRQTERSTEYLTALGQREKEFASELVKLIESGDLQRQSIETQYKEVIAELSNEYKTRESNLASQIENIRTELKTQTERSTEYLTALGQREKEFARELKQIVDEKHTTELKNSDLSHLLTAAQLLESQLKGELAMRQQILSDLSVELKKLQGSFTWRITAPLRAVAKLFISSPSDSEEVSISSVSTSSIESNLAIADSSLNTTMIEESKITQSEHPIIHIKETFMSSSPIVAATSLDELLAYHDADFIHCAYITLLGRVPDPEGNRYYLGRIRAGRAKIEIIDQIASSSEAKELSVSILGLQQALGRYRWEKIPIIGSVIRSITRHDEISCQIRQIENNIYLLGKDTCKRFDRIEKNIAIVASESIKIDNEPDELNHLSSHAREIYFQLKAAALKQEFGGTK
ncbi:MAG: DUF4214 domain-containing protein [Campylobacterales bacterium]|nr:DUF4214 domain-containing protein [Campylobacterales bacterium]